MTMLPDKVPLTYGSRVTWITKEEAETLMECGEVSEFLDFLHYNKTFRKAANAFEHMMGHWTDLEKAISLKVVLLIPQYRGFAEWYLKSHPDIQEWIRRFPAHSKVVFLMAREGRDRLEHIAKVQNISTSLVQG